MQVSYGVSIRIMMLGKDRSTWKGRDNDYANKVAAGISKKTRSEGSYNETAINPEITEG